MWKNDFFVAKVQFVSDAADLYSLTGAFSSDIYEH